MTTDWIAPMSEAWIKAQQRKESRVEFHGVSWSWPITKSADVGSGVVRHAQKLRGHAEAVLRAPSRRREDGAPAR